MALWMPSFAICRIDNDKKMGNNKSVNSVHHAIISAYKPGVTTLREVARVCRTNHHKVKRVLVMEGIEISKGKIAPFTEQHRIKIGAKTKGRVGSWKGKKQTKRMVYQNMRSHLRYDVSLEWLETFEEIERLKYLNACLRRSERFPVSSDWYIAFIEMFYNDVRFIRIYEKWLKNLKCPWLRPTIDHIIPKSIGGTNEVSNLQFLPWFENRAKCDMTPDKWASVKANISFYLT